MLRAGFDSQNINDLTTKHQRLLSESPGVCVCVGWQRGFRRFHRRSQTFPKCLQSSRNTPATKPLLISQMVGQKDQQPRRHRTFGGFRGGKSIFLSVSEDAPGRVANLAAHQSRAVKGLLQSSFITHVLISPARMWLHAVIIS